MNNSNKLLSDIVAFRTYAKFLPHLGRRESFEETINRNMAMHLDRFPKLSKEILKAYSNVHSAYVMPSMRGMQFAGDAVLKNNVRLYNCSFANIDDVRVFGEAVFILLSGAGFGFSVQKRHVSRLPKVVGTREEGTFIVQDSILGWAQAVDVLMESYLFGRVRPAFDFSHIRPKGSYLVTTGAKAPGPEPLKKALELVEGRLKAAIGRKLSSIEVYDIVCILSDAVYAGGIRRAALIALFDKFDEEMLKAKQGDWWVKTPWRARSNNSAVLLRSETTREEYDHVFNACKNSGSGEPGFIWTNNLDMGNNPCQPSWAPILTPEGIKKLEDVNVGDEVWSGARWTRVTKKWSTGIKDVYKITTNAGRFYGTLNHKVFQNGERVEVGEAIAIDPCVPNARRFVKWDKQDIMDGLMIGDGSKHKASNNLRVLFIGDKDGDYHHSEVKDLIGKHRPGISDKAWEITTTITAEELPKTYNRSIPDRFYYGNFEKKAGFLRGLFSANGCVTRGRIQYKGSSKFLVEQVQDMLSSMGIQSSLVVNKPSTIKHTNGEYISKESYNLIIYNHSVEFMSCIGFLQDYKNEQDIRNAKSKGLSSAIKEREYISTEEVFDITVEAEEHSYWTGGLLVSNCAEVGLNSMQFCNLTTINQTGVETEKHLMDRVHAATFLGTLQATYTDFPYLRPGWKEMTEKEALLGVSFTGVADNAKFITNDLLIKAAKYAIEVNQKYAAKLGINPAARVTTLKPEGTSSCVLGSSSGVHTRFADYYIRRIRMNKDDALAVYLKNVIPDLVEDDKMGSGVVVSVPQESPQGSLVRSNETALTAFYRALQYNSTWITYGHVSGDNKNNVSVTISVKDEEWDELREAMWDNRMGYNGVSLLPYDGGTYIQAPFEECTEETFKQMEELVKNVDLKYVREEEDNTNRIEQLACVGGVCEINI